MNMQELLALVLDHIRGMWRYRWWATALAWLVAIGGIFYVYSMPDVYRASAQIYVDTENVLRPLMQNLMVTDSNLNDVQLLTRTLTTRENLEKVAYATDLDLRARTQEDFERLISNLEDEVGISGGRDNIFTIEYTDRSRAKAVDVVNALTNTFIEGSLGNRGKETEVAEHTIENEIKLRENKLKEKDEERARFKRENLGFMPDQAGDYYSRLQTAVGALAGLEQQLEIAQTRRGELERQLTGEDPVIGLMSSGGGPACSRREDIDQLKKDLRELRYQYTDQHPRLSGMERTLRIYEEECEKELDTLRASGFTSASAPLEANPTYQNIRIQLQDTEVHVATLQAQIQAQRRAVDQLTQNVDRILAVESQLKQLNQDYDVIYGALQELYKSREELQTKIRVDPVASTAQFRIINRAFSDPDPSGPNRPLLIGSVLMFALGVGGALAFLLNQIFPVFFTRDKLKAAIEFPVIGSVTMLLPPEVVARRRMEALTWSLACLLLITAAAVAIALAPTVGPIVRGFLAL